MGPTNHLAYLIQHLAAALSKQSEEILQKQLGIGLSQFKILMVLEWNPRVQQSAIADSLGQSEASVSRQIKLLKAKNLLATKYDAYNLRKHITAPTTLGMQITEAATNLLRRNLGPDLAKMGEQEQFQLIRSLQQLHRAVCQAGKAGSCDHQLGL